MKIAFCVTCKGRANHLERTLPMNLLDNYDFGDAVVVVLDYNSRDHLGDYLYSRHRADMKRGRLAAYRFTEPTRFRMAHAKNLAHRLGMMEGANVLVNLDADNYTGRGFAQYLCRQFHDNERIFLWANMVKGKMDRGISGRIAVRPEAFVSVGGYDERFESWSCDDKDINLRLRMNDWEGREIEEQYLSAILHNDRVRFRDYPEVLKTADSGDFEPRPCQAIVNRGNFGTGVVYKNFEPEPIEVGPLPTRIFGIGMHKTGTTSLHHALTILGYDSAHWKSVHWAKKIWDEMIETGKSPTLEKSYAISDLPMCLLYKELDEAYPGSKFILTLRDEKSWIESVRKHWGINNPFRAQWSRDAFTNQIHRELYGQTEFDANLFISRYRRHNAEVREYFRARPRDLLVLDVDDGAGWYELCGFLRKPVPSMPYPRRNQSQ